MVDSTEFAIGADFAPLPLSGEGSVTAPVLFVGYGIEADEFDHHDYRNRDAAGKIVLALRHEPEEADPASSWAGEEFTRHATFLTKARLAKDRGALAFLTVTDPLHHEPDSLFPINHSLELTERRTSVPEDLEDFPALIVSDEVARRLLSPVLEEQEISFVELQRASESGPVVVNPVDPPVATIRLTRRRGTSIAARNVGALYRHPDGGEEGVVIVGAHHDHLGGGAAVFNGADDNASGVSALLEVAEELSLRSPKLPFSVLFLTFSAEEAGLLGSRSISGRLPAVLAPYRLMINLDMVGRNPTRPVEAYYSDLSSRELAGLEASAAEADLKLRTIVGREFDLSDHVPFRELGIPTLFLFTGFHDDYHRESDDADRIDYRRLRQVALTTTEFLVRLGMGD